MTARDARPLTLLERLDLALAARAAGDAGCLHNPEEWRPPWSRGDAVEDGLWIARALGVRGLFVDPRDAAEIVRGGTARYAPSNQELHLVRGMSRVLGTVRARALQGIAPDGWLAVDMFRRLTDGIARFRNNVMRRDAPWDAVVGVTYPDAEAVSGQLDVFRSSERFGESPDFDELHPVRQATRLLWRFGRMAPFPDFNVVMAVLVMNAFLLAKGYPMVMPLCEDRTLLAQLLARPAPRRVVQFESRLVARLEHAATRR